MMAELSTFLDDWTVDPNGIKPIFSALYNFLCSEEGVNLEYKGRPGVSHSLRARHQAQNKRSLFVLVDVIDDDPEARWLSVCFYADLVPDPAAKGDLVPGGLMGEDACCFDIETCEEEDKEYLLQQLMAATAAAGKGD